MDPSKTSFAKLTGSSNYRVWSMKMKAYLVAQDLWDVVDITPTKANDENLKSQNSKAVSLIIFSCEDHILQIIDADDLAVTIWRNLKKQFGHVGFSARHLAFQSLISTHVSSCNNVEQYIDNFRTHINTLSQLTSNPLPQWLLLSILINNVGNQFEAWSQSIMQQIRTKTTLEDSQSYFDETIASLIDEARRMNQSNEIISETALTTRNGLRPKPICIHCGKTHKSDNCWEMFPEKRPSARFSSTYTPSSQLNQFQNSSQSIAFLSQSRNWQQNTWIIDSGASHHMCREKSLFTRFVPFSMSITVANNTRMNAVGKGDVKIFTEDGNTFTLIDVLYIPELTTNLLSVCYATKNPNIRFNIMKNKSHITFKNNIIATAMLKDSLFVLETIRPHALITKIKSRPFSYNSLTYNGKNIRYSINTKDERENELRNYNKIKIPSSIEPTQNTEIKIDISPPIHLNSILKNAQSKIPVKKNNKDRKMSSALNSSQHLHGRFYLTKNKS